jgi:hypothetical protein
VAPTKPERAERTDFSEEDLRGSSQDPISWRGEAEQDRQDDQNPDHTGGFDPHVSDPPPQSPQPNLELIEEAGEGQEFAGEHPEPYDDDVAGTGRGHEQKARDDERESTDQVEDPPILPRFAPFAALAVVVVTGLEAVARLDLLEELPTVPALFRLLDHVHTTNHGARGEMITGVDPELLIVRSLSGVCAP